MFLAVDVFNSFFFFADLTPGLGVSLMLICAKSLFIVLKQRAVHTKYHFFHAVSYMFFCMPHTSGSPPTSGILLQPFFLMDMKLVSGSRSFFSFFALSTKIYGYFSPVMFTLKSIVRKMTQSLPVSVHPRHQGYNSSSSPSLLSSQQFLNIQHSITAFYHHNISLYFHTSFLFSLKILNTMTISWHHKNKSSSST